MVTESVQLVAATRMVACWPGRIRICHLRAQFMSLREHYGGKDALFKLNAAAASNAAAADAVARVVSRLAETQSGSMRSLGQEVSWSVARYRVLKLKLACLKGKRSRRGRSCVHADTLTHTHKCRHSRFFKQVRRLELQPAVAFSQQCFNLNKSFGALSLSFSLCWLL